MSIQGATPQDECSDGFMLNLCMVLLKLCQPFCQPASPRLLRIRPEYARKEYKEINDQETHQHHSLGLSRGSNGYVDKYPGLTALSTAWLFHHHQVWTTKFNKAGLLNAHSSAQQVNFCLNLYLGYTFHMYGTSLFPGWFIVSPLRRFLYSHKS